jgi:D-glycero-alpha-D-manno-heptose 1-phosphate guanylyltransferase
VAKLSTATVGELQNKHMNITTAIILAGGLGTRLRSVVADLPKCMAPVDDKPFLAYVIACLQKEGIRSFIFSLGYKSEAVVSYLEKHYPFLQKQYVIEPEPLGTGGAVQLACSKTSEQHVVVVNGDTLFNVNISGIVNKHLQRKAHCTIALRHLTNFSRYGTVELNTDGTIKNFHEKKYCRDGLINGGVYVLDVQKFLSYNLQPPFSFEKDFLEKNTGVLTLYGIESKGFFIDIGIPEDYQLFRDYIALALSKDKHKVINSKTGDSSFEAGAFTELIGEIVQFF